LAQPQGAKLLRASRFLDLSRVTGRECTNFLAAGRWRSGGAKLLNAGGNEKTTWPQKVESGIRGKFPPPSQSFPGRSASSFGNEIQKIRYYTLKRYAGGTSPSVYRVGLNGAEDALGTVLPLWGAPEAIISFASSWASTTTEDLFFFFLAGPRRGTYLP